MKTTTFLLDCFKTIFLGLDYDTPDSRDSYNVTFRRSDLFREGFFDELSKQDRALFYNSPHYKRPLDYWLDLSLEDVMCAQIIGLGVIEDHVSFDGYIDNQHSAAFDRKRSAVDNKPTYGLVYGDQATIFAYRTWDNPDELVVRVRFEIEGGHYYIFA